MGRPDVDGFKPQIGDSLASIFNRQTTEGYRGTGKSHPPRLLGGGGFRVGLCQRQTGQAQSGGSARDTGEETSTWQTMFFEIGHGTCSPDLPSHFNWRSPLPAGQHRYPTSRVLPCQTFRAGSSHAGSGGRSNGDYDQSSETPTKDLHPSRRTAKSVFGWLGLSCEARATVFQVAIWGFTTRCSWFIPSHPHLYHGPKSTLRFSHHPFPPA